MDINKGTLADREQYFDGLMPFKEHNSAAETLSKSLCWHHACSFVAVASNLP